MVNQEIEAAIARDDADSLIRWLDAGGNAGAVTTEGDSLLSLAARSGALRVVELLLGRGVPADPFGIWPSALVEAVEAGHEVIVARLLEAGADAGSEPWHEDADLPLLSAVHFGRWEIADRLLASGAVAKADPPWLAEVLAAALKASGRPRASFLAGFLGEALERFGEAPLPIDHRLLHKAATLLRKAPETRQLAERIAAGVDAIRALEEEVIDLYAEQERPDEAVRLVREASPELQSRLAGALLPHAALDERWELADELLPLAGRDIDRPDEGGRTALMYVVWNGNSELAKRLLGLGARLRRVDLTDHKSVLDWALLGHDPEVIAWLQERLRESGPAADAADDARMAAMKEQERAAEASRLALEAASEGRWGRVEELLARGVDVNARGRKDRTLLMYAARQGDRRRVEWLVQLGGDLDAKAPGYETVDMWAREAGEEMAGFIEELRRKI